MKHRMSLYVEIVPEFYSGGSLKGARVGKVYKRRPVGVGERPLIVKVNLSIDEDMLLPVVNVTLDAPANGVTAE